MTKQQIVALLGRPLTSVEDTNFDLYLDIATENLELLICTPIETTDELEDRTFLVRDGYKTAFIDIFHEIDEVKLNGTTIDPDNYTVRQWDNLNGNWFNSIVFDNDLCKKDVLEVSALWGFEPSSGADSDLPSNLQSLLAGLFAEITKKNKFDSTVQNKKVEDFSITFNPDTDLDTEFYTKYSKVISKYSICNIPNVQHGDLRCGC